MVIKKFDPVKAHNSHMGAFARIQHKGSIQSYMDEIEELSNRVQGFIMQFRVEMSLDGLSLEMKNEVMPSDTRTVVDAK